MVAGYCFVILFHRRIVACLHLQELKLRNSFASLGVYLCLLQQFAGLCIICRLYLGNGGSQRAVEVTPI